MNRRTPGLPAAAAAKSRQSCLTRCDPTDGPNRLLCLWDSPGKNTGVGCHFLLHCMKVKVKSLSRVRLLATPWTVTYQAPLSVGFSRQVYWSGLLLPSPPGLPIHHHLLEFSQTHVHQGSDAIQPSHPLSSPSPPAPNPSQHQSLFQWVSSLHEVAKVLEFQL